MSEIKLTADIRLIPIAGEIAQEMGRRLSALQGMVECIRDKLTGSADGAAADALYGVIWEIQRIAIDLDAHSWERRGSEFRSSDAANQ